MSYIKNFNQFINEANEKENLGIEDLESTIKKLNKNWDYQGTIGNSTEDDDGETAFTIEFDKDIPEKVLNQYTKEIEKEIKSFNYKNTKIKDNEILIYVIQ